jgi:hypothetical protein
MTARTKIASALDALGRRLWDARVTSTTDSDIIREAVRALLTSQPEDVGEEAIPMDVKVQVHTTQGGYCIVVSGRSLDFRRDEAEWVADRLRAVIITRHPTTEARE